MAIVKSPGGDLERYAVLSVVRIRFGLIPFEDQRLFHVGMVRHCRMRVEGTLPPAGKNGNDGTMMTKARSPTTSARHARLHG